MIPFRTTPSWARMGASCCSAARASCAISARAIAVSSVARRTVKTSTTSTSFREPCNPLPGRTVEAPVSQLLDGDPAPVASRLDDKGRELLFVWLCLLFLKVHLKDGRIPVHKDRRRGDARIGEAYHWADLHHVHAVARAPYTGASLMPEVIGSLQGFEIASGPPAGDYDY